LRDLMVEWISLLICENNYLSLFWSSARMRYTACCNAVCGGLRGKEIREREGKHSQSSSTHSKENIVNHG